MSLSELDKIEIQNESLSSSLTKFLLLDTEIIEDDDYPAPDNNADSLPVARDIVEIMRDIDLNTTRDWLWQDTYLNEHYERGPILVEIEPDSALIPYFWDKIYTLNAGVLITSTFTREQVLEHLKSILTVRLPSNSEAQLKLQYPLKHVGVFSALNDLRLSSLLGPIKNIYWTENCGPKSRYYKITNPAEHAPKNKAPNWFQWSDKEIELINAYDLQYFKQSISNTIEIYIEAGEYNGLPLDHLHSVETNELLEIIDKGIQTGNNLKIEDKACLQEYIKLNILNPYFFKQDSTKALMHDTNVNQFERMSRLQELMSQQG